jgi:hypothetical protein
MRLLELVMVSDFDLAFSSSMERVAPSKAGAGSV